MNALKAEFLTEASYKAQVNFEGESSYWMLKLDELQNKFDALADQHHHNEVIWMADFVEGNDTFEIEDKMYRLRRAGTIILAQIKEATSYLNNAEWAIVLGQVA